MTWKDILKYDSLEEELEQMKKVVDMLKKKEEQVGVKLGLITRGRTYNDLTPEEKSDYENLVKTLRHIQSNIALSMNHIQKVMDDALSFYENPETSLDFINENI